MAEVGRGKTGVISQKIIEIGSPQNVFSVNSITPNHNQIRRLQFGLCFVSEPNINNVRNCYNKDIVLKRILTDELKVTISKLVT